VRAAFRALWEHFPTIPPLTVEIASTLPHSAGLSSSAALTLAVIGAVNTYRDLQLSTEAVCGLAYAAEAQYLRTGCGQMDQYTCGLGGLLHLDCAHEPPLIVELPPLPEEVALVIGETTARHRAGNVISSVRQRLKEGDASAEAYFRETRLAVGQLYQMLASSTPNLEGIGAILTRCHGFIRDYAQVSTPEIEACVHSALEAGALGAKLTGAGNGGCMFALARKTHVSAVVQALSSLGASAHICSLAPAGLRIEHQSTFAALAR
jgi:mevalonate kinase